MADTAGPAAIDSVSLTGVFNPLPPHPITWGASPAFPSISPCSLISLVPVSHIATCPDPFFWPLPVPSSHLWCLGNVACCPSEPCRNWIRCTVNVAVTHLVATGHFVWLVRSPGTVSHRIFVPRLHYQLSKSCSRHIFSRVLISLTNCFQRIWAANIVRRPCSDSSHVTALYKLSFYYYFILNGI